VFLEYMEGDIVKGSILVDSMLREHDAYFLCLGATEREAVSRTWI